MHCVSMLHCTKINDKSNQYFSIKNTLNRISNFWKLQNEKKDNEDKKVSKKSENEKKELKSKKEFLNNLLCEQSTNDTLIGNHDNNSKKIFTQSFLSMNKGISSFDSLKKQSLLFKINKRNYQEYLKNDLNNTPNNNTKNKKLLINPTLFMKLIIEEKQKLLNPKYTKI